MALVADLVDVDGAEALLHRAEPRRGRLLRPQEERRHLLHPRDGEEHRRVVARHQRRRGQLARAPLLEEIDEEPAQFLPGRGFYRWMWRSSSTLPRSTVGPGRADGDPLPPTRASVYVQLSRRERTMSRPSRLPSTTAAPGAGAAGQPLSDPGWAAKNPSIPNGTKGPLLPWYHPNSEARARGLPPHSSPVTVASGTPPTPRSGDVAGPAHRGCASGVRAGRLAVGGLRSPGDRAPDALVLFSAFCLVSRPV